MDLHAGAPIESEGGERHAVAARVTRPATTSANASAARSMPVGVEHPATSGRTGADHSASERKNDGRVRHHQIVREHVHLDVVPTRARSSVARQPSGVPSGAGPGGVGSATVGSAAVTAAATSRLRRGPSSLQLVDRHATVRIGSTRASSRSPAAGSGKKITPNIERRDVERVGRSRSSAWPSITVGARPRARPRPSTPRRSASSMPGAKSVASTAGAPRRRHGARTHRSRRRRRGRVAGDHAEELDRVGGERAGERCEHLARSGSAPGSQPSGVCSGAGVTAPIVARARPGVTAAAARRTRCPRDRRAPPTTRRGPGRRRRASRRAPASRATSASWSPSARRVHVEVGAALDRLGLGHADDVEVGRPVAGTVQRHAVVAAVADRPSRWPRSRTRRARSGSFASRTIDARPGASAVAVARVEDAELVALGIGEHDPGRLGALSRRRRRSRRPPAAARRSRPASAVVGDARSRWMRFLTGPWRRGRARRGARAPSGRGRATTQSPSSSTVAAAQPSASAHQRACASGSSAAITTPHSCVAMTSLPARPPTPRGRPTTASATASAAGSGRKAGGAGGDQPGRTPHWNVVRHAGAIFTTSPVWGAWIIMPPPM